MAYIVEINGVEHLVDLEVAQELERLQSEARWIPVSERLPETEVDVLVALKGYVDHGYYDGTEWRSNTQLDYSETPERLWDVTHWMPLPTPPTEG